MSQFLLGVFLLASICLLLSRAFAKTGAVSGPTVMTSPIRGLVRCAALMLALALLPAGANAQNPGTWAAEAPMPTARGNLGVGVVNGLLYAVGGFNNGGALSTVDAYDPVANKWFSPPPMSMSTPRNGVSVGVINGILYAVGGDTDAGAGGYLSTVEAYDAASDMWSPRASMSTPRDTPGVGVINGILYAAGGQFPDRVALSTVEAYYAATNKWTPKSGTMNTPRYQFGYGVLNGMLYAVGGQDATSIYATVEAYDPVSDKWSFKKSMSFARNVPTVAVQNGILYAIGGEGGDCNSPCTIVEAYDPTSDMWTPAPPMPTGRGLLAAGVVNGSVFAVGGRNSSGYLPTLEAFTPTGGGAPTAVNETATTPANTPVAIDLTAGASGNPTSAALAGTPTGGTVTGFPATTVTFTPTMGFTGAASFQFTLANASGTSNVATVTITVTGAPTAVDETATTPANTPVAIDLTTGATGNPTSAALVGAPTGGTVTGFPATTVTFTPAMDFTGAASFQFTLANSSGTSNSATATISVTAPPPPTAVNEFATTPANTAVEIDLTHGASGNPTSAALVGTPFGGTVKGFPATTVTFKPNIGFSGKAVFEFTLANAGGTSNGATAVITVLPAPLAEKVLYSFKGGRDGAAPVAGLIANSAETFFYGTTTGGGTAGKGTVFKITPGGAEMVLHSFKGGSDGAHPVAGLYVNIATGNLYGTTDGGGTGCGAVGCGTVFEVTPGGAETVLYSFKDTTDGAHPLGGVTADSKGNLYGTTHAGGLSGTGSVFQLTLPIPPATKWTKKVLHSFKGRGFGDGAFPEAGLYGDNKGNFYGTTNEGGTGSCPGGCGAVFKITTAGSETVLHSFKGPPSDGANPTAGLSADSKGNLYGTTQRGGSHSSRGTVFELSPTFGYKLLHAFCSTRTCDGVFPLAGVLSDKNGNLYGTTQMGGTGTSCTGGCGTVFKVSPPGGLTVLHSFTGGTDGALPEAGLIADGEGNLYGTTMIGGGSGCGGAGCGTVFEVTGSGFVP